MDHRHDSSEFELGVVMDGSVIHSFSQTVSTELPSVDFKDFEFFMFYTSMYQSSFMDNSELELSFMEHRHDSSEFDLGVVMDGSVTHSFSQTVSTELPSVEYNDFEFFMFYISLYQSSFLNNCESELSFFDNSKDDLLLTSNDESFTATELTSGSAPVDITEIEFFMFYTSIYHTTKTIFGKDQRMPATGYISYPTLSASLTHCIRQ